MIKVLFIGHGLDPKRQEAVSVNTMRLISILSKIGVKAIIKNIGYNTTQDSEGMNGVRRMMSNLINRKKVIEEISGIINKENIKYIHDTFVFPGVSLLFSLPLKRIFPNLTFIKEIQNNPGLSNSLDYENFLRLFLNNKSQVQEIIKRYDIVMSRNELIASKLGVIYLPPLINVYSNERPSFNRKITRVCFLGHALKKKGIYEFTKLFEIVPASLRKRLVFNFALNDIGRRKEVEYLLKGKAREQGIKVAVFGTVKPEIFFRNNDILLLPLRDEFGSSSSLNTVFEAMEASCLVVTTDTKLARAVIWDNKNGCLLKKPSADEILMVIKKVIAGKIDSKIIIETARADILKKYSETSLMEKIKKIYV